MRLRYISGPLRAVFNSIIKEIGILLACLAVVAGTWIFIEIADEMVEGGAQQFDLRALEVLRTYHPKWLTPVLRDITALGSLSVLFLVTVSITGILFLRKDYRHMIFIITVTICGGVLVTVLKMAFARERPDILLPTLLKETTPGFPSGHAAMSAAVYLSIAAVLARVLDSYKARLYVISLSVAFTFLVGMTRVCLGVHYFTDVLAGWAFGFAWASFCWLVVRYLDARSKV